MSELPDRHEIRRRVRERTGKEDVPGPSNNPATNLFLADIVIRSIGRITRQSVERAMLGKRYGKDFARDAVQNRSTLHALTAYGITKVATRSVPGAMLVGSIALGKILFDRAHTRRQAQRAGKRVLEEQADPDSLV